MERPALQRLLRDLGDRRIDVVVVYKIDRLTRSLADFARIIEVFDSSGASFVSVTQQFNTTTSMGRLTLNVLLSFAQFEREVTAERIRDKIAASKAKGMWMGGTVPLGYQVRDRKLVIKQPEADFVRNLFNRYLELRSVPALAAEMTRLAIESEQQSENQETIFTRRMRSGMLYKLLANPIYIGKLRHRQNVHAGEHEAIINTALFEKVQTTLTAQAVTPRGMRMRTDLHLLNGLLFDESGDRMAPTHAHNHGKRYRYYISSRLRGAKRRDDTAWRIPAGEIETLVTRIAIDILNDRRSLTGWVGRNTSSMSLPLIFDTAAALARELEQPSSPRQREIIATLFCRIMLRRDAIVLTVDLGALFRKLVPGEEAATTNGSTDQRSVTVEHPIVLKRRRNEMRLMIEGTSSQRSPDAAVVDVVARAHLYLDRLTGTPGTRIADVARDFGVDRADVGRILRLAFLSPRLLEQILTGNHPADLSARRLSRLDLPMRWANQLAVIS